MGLSLAHERLEQHARDGKSPYRDAQRYAARLAEGDEAKRRVGTRDEHVNAAVIDDAEHTLGGCRSNGMIQRGCKILEESDAEDDRARKRRGVRAGQRRP